MNRGFSNISTKKSKNKKININQRFTQEFNAYNKQMKRLGLKTKTLDEYIAYRQGKANTETKSIKDPFKPERYIRPSPIIPSSGDQVGHIPAKPVMSYSGERIIGIAVLHKSCLQPISSRQEAEDVAKMRRN